MSGKFSFSTQQRAELRKELATTVLYTELGGSANKAYSFSYAEAGKSGYSFGLVQIDLSKNLTSEIKNVLLSVGLTQKEIDILKNATGKLSQVFIDIVNSKLASNKPLVDQLSEALLDERITRLEQVITKVQDVRPDVAESIKLDDSVKLAIMDYDNQLVVTGAGSATEKEGYLLQYLQGRSVLNGNGSNSGVPSVLGDGVGVTANDIFVFKQTQTEWGKKEKGVQDIKNRGIRFNDALKKLKLSESDSGNPDVYKTVLSSGVDRLVDDIIPLSDTQVAGGTASTDAEAWTNAINRQQIKESLSALKLEFPEDSTIEVSRTENGGLMLVAGNVSVEIGITGNSVVTKELGDGSWQQTYRNASQQVTEVLTREDDVTTSKIYDPSSGKLLAEETGDYLAEDGSVTSEKIIFDTMGNIATDTDISINEDGGQTSTYFAKTGLTESLISDADGNVVGRVAMVGQASEAQLAEVAALVKSAAEAENFGQISVSDADGSSELEVLGDDTSAAMQSALQKADQNIASGVLNTNSSPVASSGSTFVQWLYQRGGAVTGVANDRLNTIVADLSVDPTRFALADGALAVSLAQQDPSPVNVLTALQKLMLAGVTLSPEMKASFATQMGTTPENVARWISAGGAAVTSMLVALKNPTPLNIASAMQQTVLAGVTITPGLKADIADALGFPKVNGLADTATVDKMLDYGGAALSVISVLSTKNPSPQQIIQASQQVVNILDAAKENAALQNLDYTLSTLGTVYSLYNFVEHPNNQTAVAALLKVGMAMTPPISGYAAALAAVVTIAQAVDPMFVDNTVNSIVDFSKNTGGSIDDFFKNTSSSVTDVVNNTVSSIADFASNTFSSITGGGKPVTLDLDGNGLQFSGLNDSQVYFDINGDGWREQVSWVAGGDALLALDMQGDRKIDRAEEISFFGYMPGAQTDLEGLRFFDSNQDGVLNKLDARWGQFGAWVDANHDGVCDTGEFRTLDEVGITSINLNSDHVLSRDGQTLVFGSTSFTKADGSTGAVGDVAFAVNANNRVAGPETTASVTSRLFDPLVLNLIGGAVHSVSANDEFVRWVA